MPTRRTLSPRRQSAAGASGKKTRITIYLDGDVLSWFRSEVEPLGGSYQRAINLALRDWIAREPLEAMLRRVVREELARVLGRASPHAYDDARSPVALVAEAAAPGADYGAGLRRERLRRRIKKGRWQLE